MSHKYRNGGVEVTQAEDATVNDFTTSGATDNVSVSVQIGSGARVEGCHIETAGGRANRIYIDENVQLRNAHIQLRFFQDTVAPMRNTICIGARGGFNDLRIECQGTDHEMLFENNVWVTTRGVCCLLGAGNSIHIGSDTSMQEACLITAEINNRIRIGKDCMFGHGVVVRGTDNHPIYDPETMQRLNPAQSVAIGDHVWLCDDSLILRGSVINSRSIVAAHAVVTRHCPVPTANTVIGMHPSKICEGGEWARSLFFDTSLHQEAKHPEVCAESYRARAIELYKAGCYQAAVTNFDRSLALHPHEYAYSGRAAALRALGKAI